MDPLGKSELESVVTLGGFIIIMDMTTDNTDLVFRRYMDENLERTKAAAKLKKIKRKCTKTKRKRSGQYSNKNPQIAFLRSRICRLNYGIKLVDLGVRPELDKEKLVKRYNERRFGAALRNEQFQAHFDGNETFYFWADPATGTAEIIVMLDIDVHYGVGSPEGARRFAELIKEKLFPGMFYEPSTNGMGIHGYIVIEKAGVNVKAVRWALRNLDRYLKELAKSVKADISCVEIKGLPPVIRYDDHGNILDFTFGQFAKLPRGEGVLNTRRVKYTDLAFLDTADIVPAADPVIETPAAASPTEPTRTTTTIKMRLGSFDSRIVTQNILDQLPALERYAAKLLVQWTGSTSFKADRWMVTATDLAQFFAIMLAIKPDSEDALPVRRIGNLWQAVHDTGEFTRPWNHHRFKAMRDLISKHGHIDWVDFRYQNVPKKRGRACRWRLGCVLENQLRSLVEGEASSVDTDDSLNDGKYEYRTPKWWNFIREKEERWWEEAERRLSLLFAA